MSRGWKLLQTISRCVIFLRPKFSIPVRQNYIFLHKFPIVFNEPKLQNKQEKSHKIIYKVTNNQDEHIAAHKCTDLPFFTH